MSIQYVFGGSGVGKTEYCIRDILKRAEETTRPLIFIVPEQFTLETEKMLCAHSKNNAILLPQVLSFQRLAYNIFSKTGRVSGKLLDDIGKNMLLRKILIKIKKDLNFFGKAVDKPGFIDNVSQIIREFYQYNIGPNDVDIYAEKVVDNRILYIKMKDLFLIYCYYVQFISDKYILTENTLDFVPERIDEAEFLDGSEVWIDGFTGFTMQEFNIIEKLIGRADKVTVALTIKSDITDFNGIEENDPFREIKMTINKISTLAKAGDVEILKVMHFKDNYRFHDSDEMRFLEEHYLDYNINEYKAKVGDISIFGGLNRYEEVSYAAVEILRQVRDKGLKYKDIAVICSATVNYEKEIRNVFNIYGVPFFIDSKIDILSHPLTELVRSAVNILAYSWKYEHMFSYLKTGLTTLTRAETDILENYILAMGINGYKWNLEEWTAGFESGLFNKEEINTLRDKVKHCIEPFTGGLTRGKKFKVSVLSTKIFDMLDHLNVADSLDAWVQNMITIGDNITAKQHTQIYGKVSGVFDKMVEILGDELMTPAEFGNVLEAGFKAADLGIIPTSQDQVIIGDLERTRLPKIKALFLLGVNDGVLPQIKNETGIFSDSERSALSAAGTELGPDSKMRSFLDPFIFYGAITKPEKRLYLCYSKGGLDGKSMQPSSFIIRIKKMYPFLKESQLNTHDITLPKPMFNLMGGVLRAFRGKEEVPVQMKNLYSWFSKSRIYTAKLSKMEQILFERTSREYLNQKSLDRLYFKEIYSDASRLERFMKCPFSYFIQYDLMARERKIYQAKPSDYGSFFHDILEDFNMELYQSDTKWNNLSKGIIDTYVEKSVEKLAPALGNEVLLSTAKYKYVIKRISRIAKKSIWALSEHIKSGSFEPVGAEVGFGKGSPLTSISLNINDKQALILRGRIDRIDIMDHGGDRYVKVIDYKSGNTEFNLSDLYFGMQLQLMLYMDAFIKTGAEYFGKENIRGELKPGGIFYFNINDPILMLKEEVPDEKLDEIALKTFKMTGLVLKDENIIKGMDEGIKGSSSVIPVQFTEKGYGKNSSVADGSDFDALREYVLDKALDISSNMVKGDRSLNPYKKPWNKGESGCMYCNYSAICQMDTCEDNKKFNLVEKINSIDEIIRKG